MGMIREECKLVRE